MPAFLKTATPPPSFCLDSYRSLRQVSLPFNNSRRRRFPYPVGCFRIRLSKNMTTPNTPTNWKKWCKSGIHGRGARKKNAVAKCLVSGQVRGYYSDIVLRPDLPNTHSMYPSLEHLVDPANHQEVVVEARIINDMKSHLSEPEFWSVIEHLFIVGVERKKIIPPFGKRLPKSWSPQRHYTKKTPSSSAGLDAVATTPSKPS